MFWIWLIGIIVLGSIAAYCFGRMDDYEVEDIAGGTIVCIILWPIALGIVIIVAPFAIPYILGQRTKNKTKNKDK
jgi:uncharacterized membrane protein